MRGQRSKLRSEKFGNLLAGFVEIEEHSLGLEGLAYNYGKTNSDGRPLLSFFCLAALDTLSFPWKAMSPKLTGRYAPKLPNTKTNT